MTVLRTYKDGVLVSEEVVEEVAEKPAEDETTDT